MPLPVAGFANHMHHKKAVWKPVGMTINTNFCVFVFETKSKADLVAGEMAAFNAYYNYTVICDTQTHSVCIINSIDTIKDLLK